MKMTAKIVKYELEDVFRGRWVIVYALFFLIITDSLFRFGGGSSRTLVSLINIVLILIPLVSIVFGTMYIYNSREFIELLLSQPINRKTLYGGLFTGLAIPLAVAFLAGTGIPFGVHGIDETTRYGTLFVLLMVGVVLTFVFLALAFLAAVTFEDRIRGLATTIALWLFFSILYDGAIIILANIFAAYPLEKPLIGLILLNPVDLARVILLLQFDTSALMGYTGAVFKDFFGSAAGITVASLALLAWFIVPFTLGQRAFRRKDF